MRTQLHLNAPQLHQIKLLYPRLTPRKSWKTSPPIHVLTGGGGGARFYAHELLVILPPFTIFSAEDENYLSEEADTKGTKENTKNTKTNKPLSALRVPLVSFVSHLKCAHPSTLRQAQGSG
jgi:hypothetical protein